MVINTKKTIHPDPSHRLQGNFKETKAQPLVKPRTTEIDTNNHTAPHMVQQNNQQQKHFRTLNHHQKDDTSTYQDKPKRTKPSICNSSQQQ